MFSSARAAAILLPLLASLVPGVTAASDTCNATNVCPSETPCCSSYGYCGTGADFCFGGCNPMASHTYDSCMPEPICVSQNITFSSFDRILQNYTEWNGNASEYDFILEAGNIQNTTAGELVMILTEENNGTLLASTRYVHYGTITARMKVGRWGGVVTAFITMSDVKDEIDWEWPGNTTTEAQSNFFWEGFTPAVTAGETEGNLTDTYSNYHEYTIDWQEDQLQWIIDGNVVRTVTKEEMTDNSTGIVRYPATPSRVELSLWPAGISSEAEGTIEWAGGMINWSNPDYVAAGHFYAYVDWVSVTCNDSNPSDPNANVTGYVYTTNTSAYTPAVIFTNETTVEVDSSSSSSSSGALPAALLSNARWAGAASVAAMVLSAALL